MKRAVDGRGLVICMAGLVVDFATGCDILVLVVPLTHRVVGIVTADFIRRLLGQ